MNTIVKVTDMQTFKAYHAQWRQHDNLRLGQRFVNEFIKHPWFELFYCQDDKKSEQMILDWLDRHCYLQTNSFPTKII